MPFPSSATEFRSIKTLAIVFLFFGAFGVGAEFTGSLFTGCFYDYFGFNIEVWDLVFECDDVDKNEADLSAFNFCVLMKDWVAEDFSLADGQFSKRYLLLGLRMDLLGLTKDLWLEIVERISLQEAVS